MYLMNQRILFFFFEMISSYKDIKGYARKQSRPKMKYSKNVYWNMAGSPLDDVLRVAFITRSVKNS